MLSLQMAHLLPQPQLSVIPLTLTPQHTTLPSQGRLPMVTPKLLLTRACPTHHQHNQLLHEVVHPLIEECMILVLQEVPLWTIVVVLHLTIELVLLQIIVVHHLTTIQEGLLITGVHLTTEDNQTIEDHLIIGDLRTTEVHQIIEVHLITEDLQTTGVLIIEDLHRTTTGLLQMMVIEVGVVDLLIEGVDLPLEVGLVVLLHTEALLITGPQDPGVVAVGGGPTDIKTGCGVAHCKNFYST